MYCLQIVAYRRKRWSAQHKKIMRGRRLILRWRGPSAVNQRVLQLWRRFVHNEHAKQEQLLQAQAAEAELEAAKRQLAEAEANVVAEKKAAEEAAQAKLEEAAQAFERRLQNSHMQVQEIKRLHPWCKISLMLAPLQRETLTRFYVMTANAHQARPGAKEGTREIEIDVR